jgi:hypothetical protein
MTLSVSPVLWEEKAKLTASDGTASDRFGWSVSVSGNVAIAGAYQKQKGVNAKQGSAYLYEKNISTGVWEQKTILTASDGAASDQLGWAVSVSGNVAIVSAWGDDSSTGSAYLYQKNDSTGLWEAKQKLTSSDRAVNDQFGRSLSLSGDVAIVSAYLDDDRGDSSGSAYVYQKNSSTGLWEQKQKLTASDGVANDRFGSSVSVSGDVAIIGAYQDDSSKGSAYLYEKNGSSGLWERKQKLTASDGAASDLFGWSASVSGNVAIIGAYVKDSSKGAAYLYEKNDSSGVWEQKQKLTASDGAANDQFGYSVSVSGNVAIVSALLDDDMGSDSGAAYLYQKNSSTGLWEEKQKLTASDGAPSDNFGVSVSVSGNVVIVGASFDDDMGYNSGSAYAFSF